MDKELENYLDQTYGNQQENSAEPKSEPDNSDVSSYLEEGNFENSPQQKQAENNRQSVTDKAESELDYYRKKSNDAQQELLDNYRRELEYARAQRQAESQAAQAPQVDPLTKLPFDEADYQIPQELAEVYGESSPFIAAIAKQAIKAYHDASVKPLVEHLRNVEGQLSAVNASASAGREQAFAAQVYQAIPDMSQIVADPDWQGFLRSAPAISGGSYSYGDVAQQAIRTGNINSIHAIVQDFKARKGYTQQGQAQQGNHAIAPGSASIGTPSTAPRKPKSLRMSSYSRAADDFALGKITHDQFNRIQNEFIQADLEGRVIHDE